MTDPTEIELKLEFDPADRARLAASPLLAAADARDDHIVSAYFDTADRALERSGFTVRIRKTGAGRIQTVKQDGGRGGGLFVRPEWERPVRGMTPILDHAPFEGLVDAHALALLFTTDVRRSTRTVAIGDARIEIALDAGTITAGGAEQPVCELELELKSGNPQPLFALARELDRIVPMAIGVRSKAERGYALAAGAAPPAYKAEAISLAADAAAGEVLAAVAGACLRQVRLNAALVIATGAVEPVHQARVALRRLRSALSAFKPLLADDPVAPRLRDELRWLAGALGRVRDLDVLIPRLDAQGQAVLAAVRAGAILDAQLALGSARARQLMIDLAEWQAIGGWRAAPAAAMPAARLARDILDRHRARIAKRGRKLARLGDHRRHRVRIEAKKLRYASEFFAALWPAPKLRRRHRRFLAALEDLQERLGTLNDRATAAQTLAGYGIAPPPHRRGQRKLIGKAARARRALLAAKPFWPD